MHLHPSIVQEALSWQVEHFTQDLTPSPWWPTWQTHWPDRHCARGWHAIGHAVKGIHPNKLCNKSLLSGMHTEFIILNCGTQTQTNFFALGKSWHTENLSPQGLSMPHSSDNWQLVPSPTKPGKHWHAPPSHLALVWHFDRHSIEGI